MSELQKHFIGPPDARVPVYHADEVDAEIERLKASCNPEANDMIYANWQFAKQECELLRRAVEWCLENGAVQHQLINGLRSWSNRPLVVPAEFSDIIKPRQNITADECFASCSDYSCVRMGSCTGKASR